MPGKEIKELRQAGKLDEAYALAKKELSEAAANYTEVVTVPIQDLNGNITEITLENNYFIALIDEIRNFAWVLYAQLGASTNDLDRFIEKISELKSYNIPATESMLYDNLSIVIGKAAFSIARKESSNMDTFRLFESIKELPLKKPSKWYSFLFKGFHKLFKDTDRYLEFADWWCYDNFMPEDFNKEKFPDGKEVMSFAEQGYIAYSRHLLPRQALPGGTIFDREKAEAFLPKLEMLISSHPEFQYPIYYKSKLLLALGKKDEMKGAIIPFAKKKKNDFWVWELLGEAYSDGHELEFACYCKALDCHAPEEMLVNLRRKMAAMLITKEFYNEARTEIDILLAVRQKKGYKIPNEIVTWQEQHWYKSAEAKQSNKDLYRKHISTAEDLILGDIKKELIVVEFVNSDKKILNFIVNKERFGFLNYGRLIKKVETGDVFLARLDGKGQNTMYRALSLEKTDQKPGPELMKTVRGHLRKTDSASFGFVDDVFIDPGTIEKKKLENGIELEATAILSYNKKKEAWGWKAITIYFEDQLSS